MVGHPLLQRLGVREAAVGLTVPDPLPVIGYDGNAASSGTSATSLSSVRKVESSPCAPANGAHNSHHVTTLSAPYAAPAGNTPFAKAIIGVPPQAAPRPGPLPPALRRTASSRGWRATVRAPAQGPDRRVIGAEPMFDRDRQSEPEPAPSRGSWRRLAIAVAASAATIRPRRSAIVASAMKIALRNWRRAARPRHFHP